MCQKIVKYDFKECDEFIFLYADKVEIWIRHFLFNLNYRIKKY